MSITDVVRARGPLTVAGFMDLALYQPGFGYYARAAQRSGRAGDFFTSVDVGPLFGQLLALQLAEMSDLLRPPASTGSFDLVEAGAGNGRLSADILRALAADRPDVYARTRLHLVEAGAEARAAQRGTLGPIADRLASSSERVPDFDGVLIANELLDAMPVHQVVMRPDGLHEVFVEAGGTAGGPPLITREGPPSTPALADYLSAVDAKLQPGWRAEINLRAVDWIRDAARRMRRGFLMLIDYGHEARELYSVTHSAGTLTTYSRHQSAGTDGLSLGQPAWLARPGEQDITAHVDFTSVRRAAEEAGCLTIGFLDQTYFVMGLVEAAMTGSPGRLLPVALGEGGETTRRALKTLMMPGGLGSTMKVLVLGKNVGNPSLACCSYRVRIT